MTTFISKTLSPCIITVSIIILFSSASFAIGNNGFGIGFVLGDPSAITMKYFINHQHAVDAGIGDAAGDGFYLYGDYLLHFPGIIPVERFTLYLGGGAAFHNFEKNRRHEDDVDENRIEARMPVGVEFETPEIPLGIFLEIVPAMRLSPDVDFELRAGLGMRYFF